jgi:hypothetical protein
MFHVSQSGSTKTGVPDLIVARGFYRLVAGGTRETFTRFAAGRTGIPVASKGPRA